MSARDIVLQIVGVIGGIALYRWLWGFLDEAPLRRLLRHENHRIIIPAPSTEQALKASQSRREKIAQAFRSAEIALGPWIEGSFEGQAPPRPLPFEFLERGPEGDQPTRRSLEDDREGLYAQTIRLAWQYGRPELLLAERVTDVVIAAGRGESAGKPISGPLEDYPSVSVVRIRASSEDVFPWRVVISTGDPARYERALKPLADWLGIGVAVTEPIPRIDSFGQCSVGGAGMSGIVGGTVRRSGSTYGVTCAHVLSPDCGSAVVRGSTGAGTRPDAALIRTTPCFEFPRPGAPCSPASSDKTDDCMVRKTEIRKRHRKASKAPGLIYSRGTAMTMAGGVFRFPHLLLMRRPSGVLALLAQPFRTRSFSRHGDSGAWLFERGRREWLGMIIGGERDYGGAFALEAKPLVDFLAVALAAAPEGDGSTAPFSDFRTHEEER
jgi:hypothetical protein